MEGQRVFAPLELLWALIGLILTIIGTWLEVFITNAPWEWMQGGLHPLSLGVSFQVGAVLLTACMGGRNAAAMAQIAYLVLGLALFQGLELPIFTQGGSLSYIHQPGFGYLLGFVPAGWVCGHLAFQRKLSLESLALSCLTGLLIIHTVGLGYLLLAYSLGWMSHLSTSLGQLIVLYSILRLPGQLVVSCAVSVISFVMRHLMFY